MCAKYSYREQHTAFGVLPPRIPGLEKLGICDGSTVIEIQASKLGEYEEKGCVMKVLEEYTWTYRNKEIPMLRVKINQYIYKGAGRPLFLVRHGQYRARPVGSPVARHAHLAAHWLLLGAD